VENTCFLYLFVIDICTITLSFIESWAHPIVVVIVEVVVVQVAVLAIHIPHVVVVVRRPKPKVKSIITQPTQDLQSIPQYFSFLDVGSFGDIGRPMTSPTPSVTAQPCHLPPQEGGKAGEHIGAPLR
jgi:hypothetical protein